VSANASATVLSVLGLRKTYGSLAAVDGVSLAVAAGEVVGLLGPNGAGKTTTLECIEGLRRPDDGAVHIAGAGPARRSDVMGVQLQTGALPADMTVSEAMRFFCAYHGVAPRDDLIARFGLADARRRRYGDLSVGNQRRLALALAIAHQPALVLLDEPTAGLDVASRTELHAVVRELAAQGAAVLLATHDMAEAEKIADRVCILLHGRVVAEGTPREITATGAAMTKVSVATEDGIFATGAVSLAAATLRDATGGYAVYYSSDPAATVTALLEELTSRGDRLVDLRVERPSLEERFIEITGGGSS
jgi:ABC-2 type transport system ATP-binding protein